MANELVEEWERLTLHEQNAWLFGMVQSQLKSMESVLATLKRFDKRIRELEEETAWDSLPEEAYHD